MWQRLSLRYQLALLVSIVLAILLTVFSSIIYIAVQSFLYRQTTRQLQTAAVAVMTTQFPNIGRNRNNSVRPNPSRPLLARLQQMATMLTDGQTSVAILDAQGQPLAVGVNARRQGATRERQPLPAPPAAALLETIVRTRDMASFVTTNQGNQQLSLLVPIWDEDGAFVGALQLATPTTTINELLARLRLFLFGGTALAMVFGAGGSVLIGARVVRPLQRIVRASAAVADGDLQTRVALPPGNEIGQLGAAFDQMVARTAESFAAQQRFVADAAHELRTPLTAIGGSVEMLQLGAVDHQPEKRRRLLASIGREVDRMGRLVNDLLLLSRLDQRPSMQLETFDLRAQLGEVVEQMRLVAPDYHWQLDAPLTLTAHGHPDQLHQVWLNLVSNAQQHTPAGGVITVTALNGNGVTVRISDTGSGIPADEVAHVWERLYRVDKARTRVAGGHGLGLAIVESIVQGHGGTAAITSELGVGTTVTVQLPG